MEHFRLWRNKVIIGYTETCDIKLELLDISMTKNAIEAECKVRLFFGERAELVLASQILSDVASSVTGNLKTFIEAVIAQLDPSNPIDPVDPIPFLRIINQCLYIYRAVGGDLKHQVATAIKVIKWASRKTQKEHKGDRLFQIQVGGYNIAVADLVFNTHDVLRVVIQTLIEGVSSQPADKNKILKRVKRLVFMTLLLFNVIDDPHTGNYLSLFLGDSIIDKMNLNQTQPSPSLNNIIMSDLMVIVNDELHLQNVTEANVIQKLQEGVRLFDLFEDKDLIKSIEGVFVPIVDKIVRTSKAEVMQSFANKRLKMDCHPDRSPTMSLRQAGGAAEASGAAAAVAAAGATGEGTTVLWAAALMSVVAAMAAGAGAGAAGAGAAGALS
jgi:hypothetical protein